MCDCAALPPGVDWLRSLGPYAGSLQAIIHALKYDGRQTLARRLGCAARPLLHDLPSGPSPMLVPVPLHRSKSLRRGFNQAELLARALAVDWPVCDVMVRRQASSTQTRFNRAARRDNVADAFATRARTMRWLPRRVVLDRAHVVLVDDVVTTGATLTACARALRLAGVASVGAVTMARTERFSAP